MFSKSKFNSNSHLNLFITTDEDREREKIYELMSHDNLKKQLFRITNNLSNSKGKSQRPSLSNKTHCSYLEKSSSSIRGSLALLIDSKAVVSACSETKIEKLEREFWQGRGAGRLSVSRMKLFFRVDMMSTNSELALMSCLVYDSLLSWMVRKCGLEWWWSLGSMSLWIFS